MKCSRDLCRWIKPLFRSWFAPAGSQLLKLMALPVYCAAGFPQDLGAGMLEQRKTQPGGPRFVVLDWVLARRVTGVHLPTQVTPPYLDWFTYRFSYSKSSPHPTWFVKQKTAPLTWTGVLAGPHRESLQC